MRNRSAVLVFILIVGLFQAGCRSKEGYLDLGKQFVAQGKYADASIQFRKAIQRDGAYGEAYLRYGEVLTRLNQNDEAFAALTRAADLMPASDEAQAALGRVSLKILLSDGRRPQAQYQTAEKVTQRLLSRNSSSFEGHRLKGYLAMIDRKSGDAIAAFQSALQAKPGDPEVTTVLVQNLLLEKRDAEAEKLARESLQAMRSYGPLYDTLYSIYIRSGRAGEAEQLLRSKIANNPAESYYVVQLADHFQQLKKAKEADELIAGFISNTGAYPTARLDAGNFYRKYGRLDEAAVLFQKGMEVDPARRKDYLTGLAGVRMEQRRYAEASGILDEILKTSPEDRDALSSRASLRMASGKPEEMKKALDEFTRLVEKHPDQPQLQFLQARAFRQLGQSDKAMATLQGIMSKGQGSREVLREMADIAIRGQRAAEALQYADRLLEVDPNDAGTRLVRTSAWALQGRFGEVRSELRRILADNPDMPEALLQMATLQMEEKNYVEAERILVRLYQPGKPSSMPALRRLVSLYIRQGQMKKALAVASDEVSRSSNSPESRMLLASTASQAGDLDLALQTIRQLAADFPDSSEHWLALGELQQKKGALNDAVASFQKARQASPADAYAAARHGSALGELGRYPEAVAAYREAVRLKPDDPLLRNNLAWHIALSGSNLDEAIAMARAAMEKDPANIQFADTLGVIYLQSKQLDLALQTLQRVVNKEPTNPEFRIHFAQALIAQGQVQKARSELNSALGARSLPAAQEEQIRKLLKNI